MKIFLAILLCLILCGCGRTFQDEMVDLELNQVIFVDMAMKSNLDKLLSIDRPKKYFLICRVSKEDMEEIQNPKYGGRWTLIPTETIDKLTEAK